MIVGIDEVGRGPWAGPLVFGAVVLGEATIDGLTDSKKITKKKRDQLNIEIREHAAGFGIGWVSADEIDTIGLGPACELGCRRALEQITIPYTEIILDGTVNFLKNTGKGRYVKTLKQADLLVPCVSAASIIAKVARDRFMEEQALVYPEYGFDSHVGYGTQKHLSALQEYGATPLHRKSFSPIQKILGNETGRSNGATPVASSVTTRVIGNISEDAAAEYMRNNNFKIIERNWKTRVCEIDIIAKKDETYYFAEVKHRKEAGHGDGLAAITKKKLEQMTFSARVYVHSRHEDTVDMKLVAVATTGNPAEVTEFLVLD